MTSMCYQKLKEIERGSRLAAVQDDCLCCVDLVWCHKGDQAAGIPETAGEPKVKESQHG